MLRITIGKKVHLLYGLFYTTTNYEILLDLFQKELPSCNSYNRYSCKTLYPVKLIVTGPKEEIKAILTSFLSSYSYLPELYLNDRLLDLKLDSFHSYHHNNEPQYKTNIPFTKLYKSPLYGTYIGYFVNHKLITRVLNKSNSKEDQLYHLVKKHCKTPFLEKWKKDLWDFFENQNFIIKIPEISVEKIDYQYFLDVSLSLLDYRIQSFLEKISATNSLLLFFPGWPFKL